MMWLDVVNDYNIVRFWYSVKTNITQSFLAVNEVLRKCSAATNKYRLLDSFNLFVFLKFYVFKTENYLYQGCWWLLASMSLTDKQKQKQLINMLQGRENKQYYLKSEG